MPGVLRGRRRRRAYEANSTAQLTRIFNNSAHVLQVARASQTILKGLTPAPPPPEIGVGGNETVSEVREFVSVCIYLCAYHIYKYMYVIYYIV